MPSQDGPDGDFEYGLTVFSVPPPGPYESTHHLNTEEVSVSPFNHLLGPNPGSPTLVHAFQVDGLWLQLLIGETYQDSLVYPDEYPLVSALDTGPLNGGSWHLVEPTESRHDDPQFLGKLFLEDDPYTPFPLRLVVRDLVTRRLLPAGLPFLVHVRN